MAHSIVQRGAEVTGRSSHSFHSGVVTTTLGLSTAGRSIKSANQNNRGNPWHRGGDSRSRERRAGATAGNGDGLVNLTYVSDSRIRPGTIAVEIEAILASASDRNVRDQITGALLFTGDRFVQTIEGTATNVDAMLASIARDPRHAGLCVIDRHAVATRNFPHWSLTYVGPSVFVERTVARGLAVFHAGEPGDVGRLLKMMIEFGAAPPVKPEA